MVHAEGAGITFLGSDGSVQVDRGRIAVTVGQTAKAKAMSKGDRPLKEELDRLENEFLSQPKLKLYRSTDHSSDWLSAIRTRKKPICDVEIGARTVTVCHLANLAYYHGQRMEWNPERGKFSGGTGDARWLDIPYRGPWTLG